MQYHNCPFRFFLYDRIQYMRKENFSMKSAALKGVGTPTDLTCGPVLPVLARYAIPMFASMFFQQAYNLADSWIAGNKIGSEALGAVGTCYPITVFFIAIASGLSIGTSIFCSQQFGAKEYGQVRTAIRTAFICFLPFSLLLTGLALPAVPAILRFLAVPPEALDATARYLTVYLAGLPFLFLYNITTGILNGLGDSKTPLLFLTFSSVLNILLDLALVITIPMGVAGLALATLTAQAISSFATLWAVTRMDRQLRNMDGGCACGDTSPSAPARFSLPVLQEILRLAIPSVVQHVFMSTGQLVMQNVINSYGLITMAGYSVAFRINGLYVNSLMALSNALSGFIAQNKGAGIHSRIRSGFTGSMVLAALFSAAVAGFLLLRGEAVLSFFMGEVENRAATIEAGMGFITIVCPFYMMVFAKCICDGALRGIGAMKLFMMSTISDVLVRMFCGHMFSDLWGIRGVWWIWPFAWLIGTSVSVIGWFRHMRRLR